MAKIEIEREWCLRAAEREGDSEVGAGPLARDPTMPDLREIERIKAERLLDVLRRVIANPHNAPDVARALAADWFPLMKVDPQGNISFAVAGYNDL